MKTYTYKVVGVTFKGNDGPRQKVLKGLFNGAVKEEADDFALSFEEYDFEGSPALRVLLDGLDIGNIAAEQVEDVKEIYARCEKAEPELSISGTTFGEYLDLLESWRTRKQDLKDGIIDEYDIEDMKEQLDEIKEDPLYSAKICFYVKEPEDDLPKPEPEPEPEKKRFSLFRRKK